MAEERKRELILAPGEYAYILDGTKGQVKLYVGPIVINQTNQDQPVKYDERRHTFTPVALEDAKVIQKVVPVGFYAVLTNPARDKAGKLLYPTQGRVEDTPDLLIGHKVNIPGPVNFALWPGQTAEVLRGHHLGLNEFLVCKVYDEASARENWSKGTILKQADSGAQTSTQTEGSEAAKTQIEPTISKKQAPPDLVMGKQFNILGTEVSFFIPPTGVSVIPSGLGEDGKPNYVHQAETLEQLEYAILVDEDGNKEYPRGPSVVYPRPTQRFMTDSKGNRKFRAIEMNALQGIQLKFMKPVTLIFADNSKHEYAAGDEVFITGKEMPIYYPEEGHQLVRYDGRAIHYAVAVPEGEARYVMNRMTGEIKTVEGPTMLLPDPVKEIIVRRALSDGESITWFPGSDGTGSRDALAYNQWLRAEAARESTTRSGVVSEGRLERSGITNDQMDSISDKATDYASAAMERGASARAFSKSMSLGATKGYVPESRQGKYQENSMVGDTAERKSTFNEPRTLTFANKYKGVPTIRIQPGYAVEVVDADGSRKVVIGPKTVLLKYGQTLGVLRLSTGKPKTTDKLFSTAYLNIRHNRVADVIDAETSDHVPVQTKLIYTVNFEGDSSLWFSIENYVKHMCDHVRSVVKGLMRKYTIAEFHANSTQILREMVLGVKDENGKRPGMVFEANGMHVTDVEVMFAEVKDRTIAELLNQTQLNVVRSNIKVAQANKELEVTEELERIARETEEVKLETKLALAAVSKKKIDSDTELHEKNLELERAKKAAVAEFNKLDEAMKDFVHAAVLARNKAVADQDAAVAKAQLERDTAYLEAQAAAVIKQMGAIDPHLIAALESMGAQEMLVKVAESMSFQSITGTPNALSFITGVFKGTPVAALIEKAMTRAGVTDGLNTSDHQTA